MSTSAIKTQPLASRMRPRTIEEYVGQSHLLAQGKPLAQAIQQRRAHSMILWGPAGCGKTTLARLIGASLDAEVKNLSAVLAGVKEIRDIAKQAEQRLISENRATVLFVDEVHRFNKAQQDAFLPYVEEGTMTLIGATTENPSFELNNALLSRARVYVLKRLGTEEIRQILEQALADPERGYGRRKLNFPEDLKTKLAEFADGDARQALNMLEIVIDFAEATEAGEKLTEEGIEQALSANLRRFDKNNDLFYEQISALHKAVRGSSPDAALYWFARMIDGGCDPEYIARRAVRMASEDIGNAEPNALNLALNAWETYRSLGSPEGELAIAQAIVYLAVAPKSNAVYTAYKAALEDAKKFGSLEVPLHIRNAPTQLMKKLDYGKDYRYAHDEPEAYAAGVSYLPEPVRDRRYYLPSDRGVENKIKAKLEHLRELDRAARAKSAK